jgi:hypothetical protein
MKHIITLLLSSFFASAVFSQKDFYIPKALIIPLHEDKQVLFTSIGVGKGVSIDLSYALTNHLSVFTTGTIDRGTRRRMNWFGDRYIIKKNDNAFTAGIGYSKIPDKVLDNIEIYTGYGRYNVDNYWYFRDDPSLGITVTKADYWNVFCQLNISKNFLDQYIGWSVRFSFNKYNNVLFYDSAQIHPDYIKKSYPGLKGVTIDPAFWVRCSVWKIFIALQAGFSLELIKHDITEIRTYSFMGQTRITSDMTNDRLAALFAKLSLQYNLNFKRKK